MDNKVLSTQEKIAYILVAWRIPGAIMAFLAAIVSDSVVLWLEFVENISILIPGIILVVLSRKLGKNLKYRFNYGTGKVEAIAAFGCEMFDIAGLLCITFFAVRRLFSPEHKYSFMGLALCISILGLLIDIFILYKEKKINEKEHSRLFHTAYISSQKEFAFDGISISTLVVSIIFREYAWSVYISPIVCIIAAIPFVIIVFKNLVASVSELMDQTLDEESQLKIIKVLNEYYDSYEEFGEIRSRITGKFKQIDIDIKFRPDFTYDQVSGISKKIIKRIEEEMGECKVNVVIN